MDLYEQILVSSVSFSFSAFITFHDQVQNRDSETQGCDPHLSHNFVMGCELDVLTGVLSRYWCYTGHRVSVLYDFGPWTKKV